MVVGAVVEVVVGVAFVFAFVFGVGRRWWWSLNEMKRAGALDGSTLAMGSTEKTKAASEPELSRASKPGERRMNPEDPVSLSPAAAKSRGAAAILTRVERRSSRRRRHRGRWCGARGRNRWSFMVLLGAMVGACGSVYKFFDAR